MPGRFICFCPFRKVRCCKNISPLPSADDAHGSSSAANVCRAAPGSPPGGGWRRGCGRPSISRENGRRLEVAGEAATVDDLWLAHSCRTTRRSDRPGRPLHHAPPGRCLFFRQSPRPGCCSRTDRTTPPPSEAGGRLSCGRRCLAPRTARRVDPLRRCCRSLDCNGKPLRIHSSGPVRPALRKATP